MTDFYFTELVNDPPALVLSAAIGVDASNKLGTVDVGKGMKLAANDNYVAVAKDDEIEGVLVSISPETVNDGFSFGGVQVNRRVLAIVGASQAGNIAIGALVVADTPTALGTAGIVRVYTGSPAAHKWRVIRIVLGTGATNDTVLLEKI